MEWKRCVRSGAGTEPVGIALPPTASAASRRHEQDLLVATPSRQRIGSRGTAPSIALQERPPQEDFRLADELDRPRRDAHNLGTASQEARLPNPLRRRRRQGQGDRGRADRPLRGEREPTHARLSRRTCFRWRLRPHHATADAMYGTHENVAVWRRPASVPTSACQTASYPTRSTFRSASSATTPRRTPTHAPPNNRCPSRRGTPEAREALQGRRRGLQRLPA